MRVLTVTTTFPRWADDSIPRFVFDLARHLVRRPGIEIRVVAPHAACAATSESMDGIDVRRFRYSWPATAQTLAYNQALHVALGSSVLKTLQVLPFLSMLAWSIEREVRRFRPDLIHCHWLIPQGTFCSLIGRLHRVPVLITVHGTDVFGYRNRFVDWIRRRTVAHVDAIVPNSPPSEKRVLEFDPPEGVCMPIVPMGVDTTLFTPQKYDVELRRELVGEGGHMILGVGRLSAEKGHKYLLAAMPRILEYFPQAVLVVVGYGPEESSLKKSAYDMHLSDHVRWMGPRTPAELAPLYASADLAVTPSIRTSRGCEESLGLVTIEAMASGTAPVASRIGGIVNVITHGSNGLLCEERNPVDIADKVVHLLADRPNRVRLAMAARQTALNMFSWTSIAEQYHSLYKTLCGN
jgi:glycosyltransferase involved in cell wall biosynthesis